VKDTRMYACANILVGTASLGDAGQIRCVNNSTFIFRGFLGGSRAASPFHTGNSLRH